MTKFLKIVALSVIACAILAFAVQSFAAGPAGQANDIQVSRGDGTFKGLHPGAGLHATSTALDVTVTGASPAVGVAGVPQISNGDGTFYGPPVLGNSYTQTSAASNQGSKNAKAWAALTNGRFVSPLGTGAKCTGWYGLISANVSVGGTGWTVGDTFLAYDDNLSNMGGYISVPATGHVTAVSSGVVTAVAIDTPGSGYRFNAFNVMPLMGTGDHLTINPSVIRQGPSNAPSVTLASGGGAAVTPTAGFQHIAAGEYNVGDLFAIPNSSYNVITGVGDGNYVVGRVDSVTTTHAIATFHLYNYGGDYAITNNVPAITLTGTGLGATFNVTSATFAVGTFDDTYGLVVAEVQSRAAGGEVVMSDNCWTNTWPMINGANITGGNPSPSYGLSSFWPTSGLNDAAGARRAPILNVYGTPSTYVIDLNGTNGGSLYGFQLIPYTGQNFGVGTTWDTTIAIGSSVADPLGTGGNGAGGRASWRISHMAAHYFKYGFGTQSSGSPLIFLNLDSNDWGGNGLGSGFGAMSDFVETNDIYATVNGGYTLEITSGGGARIGPNNRCEFSKGCWKFDTGGPENNVWNNQATAIQECAVLANNSRQTLVSGNQFTSVGLGGTLKVTNAVDNGSGLIRLTVTGLCAGGGGSATCDTPTGSVVNVQGVTGTTEANGNQQTVTNVDGSHLDIQGSTFTHAYVSGGTVAVNQKDAPLCVSSSTGFYATGNVMVGFGSGFFAPSAVMVDATNSSDISIIGGTATSGAANNGSWTQAFGNWENSTNVPPISTDYSVGGNAIFNNRNVGVISGLALTSTSGGIYSGTGLAAVTTTAPITFSGLHPAPHTYNCQGGDTTLANTWPMSATTSTSCSLNATTSNTDKVWWSGQAN